MGQSSARRVTSHVPRRVVPRARRLAAALLLGAALPGCSLPLPFSGRELIMGYVEVDEAEQRVRRVTPGLDLSAYGARPGLSLGWSDTSWFVAPLDADGRPAWRSPLSVASDGYRFPLGWQWSDGTTRSAVGWLLEAPPGIAAPERAVLAVHHGFLGLDMTWSELERGLQLGFGRSVLLALPIDADGVWLFDFHSATPSSGRLVPLDLGGSAP